MRTNVLAVVDPQSMGLVAKLFQLSEACDISISDSQSLAIYSIFEQDYDLILLDTAFFFSDEMSPFRWIKFLKPDLHIILMDA